MKHVPTPRLEAYLRSWFTTSTNRKIKDGITVKLTFAEFVGLFEKRQLLSLERQIANNSIRYFMREDNPFAYVLTWRSYEACSARVFNKDTATIASRMKSGQINLPQKGDKLRPRHKANIGKSLMGLSKSDDHRKKLSESMTGRSNGPMTAEQKAIRSAAAKAMWAAKRTAKAGEC